MKNIQGKDRLLGFLGVFLGFIGFLIIFLGFRKNSYALAYGKQGLALSICCVVIVIIGLIPILGWLILIIGAIVMPILWIWGMVAALRGKVSRVPLLGRISDGFSF